MSTLWSLFVHVLQAGIFSFSQFYGGSLGAAIVSFSLLARLALLPLTVRVSRQSRAHARKLKLARPELARVGERWKEDPARLLEETTATYGRHDLRVVDPSLLKGTLAQTPLALGLFQSIRGVLSMSGSGQPFMWIKNLAGPDLGLAVLVASLVGVGSIVGGAHDQPRWVLIVPMLATFLMLLKLSAGFGLYMGASALVSNLQTLIVRREEARQLR